MSHDVTSTRKHGAIKRPSAFVPKRSRMQSHEPGNGLDAELLLLASSKQTESDVHLEVRRLAILATPAKGVGLIRKDSTVWRLAKSDATGRLPDSLTKGNLPDSILTTCESTCVDGHVETVPVDDGWFVTLAGIDAGNPETGVLCLAANSSSASAACAIVARKFLSALRLWHVQRKANESAKHLDSLAAIMEIVDRIENADDLDSAASQLAADLKTMFNCESVVVGLNRNDRLKLTAISGEDSVEGNTDRNQAVVQAMQETIARGRVASYPPFDESNSHMLLCHHQLAKKLNQTALVSCPLNDSKDCAGAILVTGKEEGFDKVLVSRMLDTLAPRVATAFGLLRKVEPGGMTKLVRSIGRRTSFSSRLLMLVALVGIFSALWMPVPYRVRTTCVVDPVTRSFAVAPFDGLLVSGFVSPGDEVKEGQVLAELDGQTVKWELSANAAKREQAVRQREIKLVERNIPETIQAELEIERLASEASVLNYRMEHLKIRSRSDGVVLSGSLESRKAAAISTGEVLFEIAPLDSVKLEIAIPSAEIAFVEEGCHVTVQIEGHTGKPVVGRVGRIYPRSEIRQGNNVFVAEIIIDNPEGQLKPGLNGLARIDCESKPLAWCLFRKPLNAIRNVFAGW